MLWRIGNVLINLAEQKSLPSLEVSYRQETDNTLIYYVRVVWPPAQDCSSAAYLENREDCKVFINVQMEVELFTRAVAYVHNPSLRIGDSLISRRDLLNVMSIKKYPLEGKHVFALNYPNSQLSIKCDSEKIADELEAKCMEEISILRDPDRLRGAVIISMSRDKDQPPDKRPLRMIDMEGRAVPDGG